MALYFDISATFSSLVEGGARYHQRVGETIAALPPNICAFGD
jgi:hypothetical protein